MGLVKLALSHVGWGMVFIVGQEIVAHGLNALGWRWAFSREDARAFSLAELVRLRVAGDAVNYLTPIAEHCRRRGLDDEASHLEMLIDFIRSGDHMAESSTAD